ncbi:MAG TPA: MFS transporter [Actinomycetota bacterium]|nr:MFS transporter [Actinomycetota bacterium]
MGGSFARARGSLRSRDFDRLLGARLTSQFADGVFQAFLIDRLVFLSASQGTAASVARAFAVLVIPFSIVGPVAGVLIDRWSRRAILTITPLLRAVACLCLVFLTGTGWMLYALALVIVSLDRFYLSTAGAVMPLVVPEDDLLVANSMASATGTVATFLGLVVGSQVAGPIGDRGLLVATCLLWPASAGVAALIRSDLRLDAGELTPRLAHIPRELWRGARRLVVTPPALGGIVTMSFDQFLFGLITVLSVVVFKVEYKEGVASYGRIIAAGGIGVIAGLLSVGWFEDRLAKPRIVALAFAAGGIACVAAAPAIAPPTILAVSFVLGLVFPWKKIPVDTVVQETTPDRFRGRVFSLYDLGYSGSRVLAAFAAVLLVPHLTSGEILGIVGAAYLVWTPVYPAWARRRARVGLRFYEGAAAEEEPREMVVGGEPERVDVLGRWLEERGGVRTRRFRLRTPDGVVDVAAPEGSRRWTVERERPIDQGRPGGVSR